MTLQTNNCVEVLPDTSFPVYVQAAPYPRVPHYREFVLGASPGTSFPTYIQAASYPRVPHYREPVVSVPIQTGSSSTLNQFWG